MAVFRGSSPEKDFLAGGGALGALIREHDWSSTLLGPPEVWPQPLKTLVNVILGSNQPMFIVWGEAHAIKTHRGAIRRATI